MSDPTTFMIGDAEHPHTQADVFDGSFDLNTMPPGRWISPSGGHVAVKCEDEAFIRQNNCRCPFCDGLRRWWEGFDFESALEGVNPSDFFAACTHIIPALREMTELNATSDCKGNVVFIIYGAPNGSVADVQAAIGKHIAGPLFKAAMIENSDQYAVRRAAIDLICGGDK
jgi:hypothetical protein